MLYWISCVFKILTMYTSSPMPTGVFNFFKIHASVLGWLNMVMLGLAIFLLFAYLFEFKMCVTTLLLFVVSVYVFSLEESNGILRRASLLSFVFFAQFLAYLLYYLKIMLSYQNNRIIFSIQAISAAYTLSAISKLTTSGFNWVFSGKYIAIQIIKSYQYKFVTTGDTKMISDGEKIADFIINQPNLIVCLLSLTLLLEFFAFVACINKRASFLYGLALLIMHFIIYTIMKINLKTIWLPMALFFVLPTLIELIESIRDKYFLTAKK